MKPVDSIFPSLQASKRHHILEEDPTTYHISGNCPITKLEWDLTVDKKGYLAWLSGTLIQKALPGLSDDERELLLSGTSKDGWDLLFKDDQ